MKYTLLLLAIFGATGNVAASAPLPLNPIRRLLCHVRGGDYLHPGDAQAIDTVLAGAMQYNPEVLKNPVLDVGCGYGGTINYLAAQGLQNLVGIDIDASAIAYAQKTYPSFTFLTGNATDAAAYSPHHSFGLICLFSVIYAIKDKESLLKTLATVAQPGAILALWDYTTRENIQESAPLDAAHASMHPIVREDLTALFPRTGWEFLKSEDITTLFIESYTATLADIAQRTPELARLFGEDTVNKTQRIYQDILRSLTSGVLGGAVIYARRKAM